MSAPAEKIRFSRRTVVKGGALIVGFALTGKQTSASAQGVAGAPRRLDAKEVDAFLAVNGDGSVTVYCGKVDLGQGLRVAIPQIAAEELGIGIEKIRYIEGDTALTPNQGRTSGSTGIQRGGMQIRQAAATARKALIDLAAQRLNLIIMRLSQIGKLIVKRLPARDGIVNLMRSYPGKDCGIPPGLASPSAVAPAPGCRECVGLGCPLDDKRSSVKIHRWTHVLQHSRAALDLSSKKP